MAGVLRVRIGPGRRERAVEKELTAYHEAAHMVAAWELGLTVTGATIVPNLEEGYAGYVGVPVENRVRYADWVDETEYLHPHLVTYYAGIAASERYTGAPMSDSEVGIALGSYGSDYYNVGDIVLALAGPNEVKQVEVSEAAQRAARDLIALMWEQVERIAGVLLERETLDEGECRQVLVDVELSLDDEE